MPPVVDQVDVRPGDRWTYQTLDDITGEIKYYVTYTVTEIRDKTFSVQATYQLYGQTASTSVSQTYDDKWNFLDDAVWTRKPGDPQSGIKTPLKVGDRWKAHIQSSRKNPDVSGTIDAVSKVTAFEPVILKFNKTYDAFKIEVAEAYSSGVSPTVVTTNITQWFSPEVNRYVKRVTESRTNSRLTSRMIEQLSSYKRRHDD